MQRQDSQPIDILMIEDSPADVRLTQLALSKAKVLNRLTVISDGAEAISYLDRSPPHENAAPPDLVLLDLNLPKVSGHEILRHIRETPRLSLIPVVILTSSEGDADILKSYELHANCYVAKPVNLERFMSVIQNIESFWVSVVKLPAQK